VLIGHVRQAVLTLAPSEAEYVPAGQLMHVAEDVAATVAEYVPTGHEVQLLVDDTKYVPALQFLHTVSAEVEHGEVTVWPAEQGVHRYSPRSALAAPLDAGLGMSSVLLVPCCPYMPCPQHCTVMSSARRMHAWLIPSISLLGMLHVDDGETQNAPPRFNAGRESPISPLLSPIFDKSPIPSWYASLEPQHLTWLLSMMTHAYLCATYRSPAVRPVPKLIVEDSVEALLLDRVSPNPSCPASFWPQHLTVLLVSSAHVKLAPVPICMTVRPKFTVARELPMWLAEVPLDIVSLKPSCPNELDPQHLTALVLSSTQVWLPPTAIWTGTTPEPSETAGSASPISPAASPIVLLWPRPSCPNVLRPQHLTCLLSRMAQVWLLPTAMEVAVLLVPRETYAKRELVYDYATKQDI